MYTSSSLLLRGLYRRYLSRTTTVKTQRVLKLLTCLVEPRIPTHTLPRHPTYRHLIPYPQQPTPSIPVQSIPNAIQSSPIHHPFNPLRLNPPPHSDRHIQQPRLDPLTQASYAPHTGQDIQPLRTAITRACSRLMAEPRWARPATATCPRSPAIMPVAISRWCSTLRASSTHRTGCRCRCCTPPCARSTRPPGNHAAGWCCAGPATARSCCRAVQRHARHGARRRSIANPGLPPARHLASRWRGVPFAGAAIAAFTNVAVAGHPW